MMTEAGPGSEAADPMFPNNNPPPVCAGAGAYCTEPPGYPLLHLPSLPQHHLGTELWEHDQPANLARTGLFTGNFTEILIVQFC